MTKHTRTETMRRLTTRIAETGHEDDWAVNEEGEGLFYRTRKDAAYHQIKGTGQFQAHTAAELEKKLRDSGRVMPNDQVTATFGWPEDER